MNILPFEKQVAAIACLVDGTSIRATSRLIDAHQDTIGNLALATGEGCALVHDAIMRELPVTLLQLDEQWSYIHTKQGHLHAESLPEHGDCWTFVAFDVPHRAVISYLVGKRSAVNTDAFLLDVERRIVKPQAPSLPTVVSDGYKPYVNAVQRAFGKDVNFGMLVKMYEGDDGKRPPKGEQQPRRRKRKKGRKDQLTAGDVGAEPREPSPSGRNHYKDAMPVAVTGKPKPRDIQTSYVERSNLTTRMCLRRFTRRCNAFSKSFRHHRAAVALHYAYYNFVRPHRTLRTTPALALGITDHEWTLDELVAKALTALIPPPIPTVEQDNLPPPISAAKAGVRPEIKLVRS